MTPPSRSTRTPQSGIGIETPVRFACIEFTTKAGKIWCPTPERPNYLCDPEREIDPTSFGCYTSALNGAHIPLSGLIYGSPEQPPSALRRLRHDLTRRMTGKHRWYDLSFLASFDVLLVIYQISNDAEIVRFVQRVRAELPNILLVSCSSPPFGRLREYWKDHPETIARYQTFLNATHVNMNVCRATVPFYRLLTTTPSLYLPQPYPVEYAINQTVGGRQRIVKREGPAAPDGSRGGVEGPSGHDSVAEGDREQGPESQHSEPRWGSPTAISRPTDAQAGPPIVYVAGDTVRPDIVTGHLIATVLQQRHPELHIRVTKTPEFSLNTAFLKGTRFEVVPFRPWADQVRELASVRLAINTDLWWTRGRVPVDCAAAGVPCVGTTSDGQTELWPELAASESTDVDHLMTLAERVLTDDAFRAAVASKAQRRLTQYAYGPTVQRFARAVELTRTGRLAAWRDPVWKDDMLVWPTP